MTSNPRPWKQEWTRHRLKWLTCPCCGAELDFLVPIDTAADFNIIKAQHMLDEHRVSCPKYETCSLTHRDY